MIGEPWCVNFAIGRPILDSRPPPRSIWFVDPIPRHCCRNWRANDLRRDTIFHVLLDSFRGLQPLHGLTHVE